MDKSLRQQLTQAWGCRAQIINKAADCSWKHIHTHCSVISLQLCCVVRNTVSRERSLLFPLHPQLSGVIIIHTHSLRNNNQTLIFVEICFSSRILRYPCTQYPIDTLSHIIIARQLTITVDDQKKALMRRNNYSLKNNLVLQSEMTMKLFSPSMYSTINNSL